MKNFLLVFTVSVQLMSCMSQDKKISTLHSIPDYQSYEGSRTGVPYVAIMYNSSQSFAYVRKKDAKVWQKYVLTDEQEDCEMGCVTFGNKKELEDAEFVLTLNDNGEIGFVRWYGKPARWFQGRKGSKTYQARFISPDIVQMQNLKGKNQLLYNYYKLSYDRDPCEKCIGYFGDQKAASRSKIIFGLTRNGKIEFIK